MTGRYGKICSNFLAIDKMKTHFGLTKTENSADNLSQPGAEQNKTNVYISRGYLNQLYWVLQVSEFFKTENIYMECNKSPIFKCL